MNRKQSIEKRIETPVLFLVLIVIIFLGFQIQGEETKKVEKIESSYFNHFESCRYFNDYYEARWKERGETVGNRTEAQINDDFVSCLLYKDLTSYTLDKDVQELSNDLSN